MPTVYSASSSQWPLLQSKTEQKFKSGLFNVSAEFIRPVGNTDLPDVIETSIGDVDVWPEPTVSVGTDGFERINATGYGVWDANASASTFGYELGELVITFRLIDKCTMLDGCGEGKPCGSILAITPVVRNISVILETVHIAQIGDTIPGSPTLKAFYTNGTQLPVSINIGSIEPSVSPSLYSGVFDSNIIIEKRLVNIKKNVFGAVKETEVIYQAVPYVSFGSFYQITNCPS
jgi:hypothetical protein